MKQKLFTKDFTLVVLGQIISLFGNAAIRFALPLYLLNLTGSSALYGTVTACAFLPPILLSPIGGMIADRVNKRNVMVVLDFLTAVLILTFSLLMGTLSLVPLLTVTLMLLYGIAGTYQPSVQASIPALVCPEQTMAANSVINTVSSFSSLTGPVLGGLLYSAWGLKPVLWVCTVCFFLSAVMELFIRIPFQRQNLDGGILSTVKNDFSESIRFLRTEKPIIQKGMFVVCGINLFLSAMILVAMPWLITEILGLDAAFANRLYGFAQGALAAGGLAGGILSGIFADRLHVRTSAHILAACALCIFPIGITLLLSDSGILNYLVLTICCFFIMVCSTIFMVQMMTFIQTETPPHLTGKVISLILTVSMCSQPLGNAMYGILFEAGRGYEYAIVLFSASVSLMIAVRAQKIFRFT